MHQILTCPEDQLQGFLSRIVEWNYAKARPLPPHPNPLPPLDLLLTISSLVHVLFWYRLISLGGRPSWTALMPSLSGN